MDSSCFKYSLTNQERDQFETEGYIIVKNVLNDKQIAKYINLINNLYQPPGFFFLDTLLDKNEAFLDLIDNPKILPKIWKLLSWNIYLYHSHLSATPFCGNKNDKSLIDWHQDSGRLIEEVSECNPAPRISVKVCYFLTDTLKPRMGNLMVVPGSHLKKPDFSKKIEVCVNAGDVCIFDRRLWHAPGANCSDKTRLAMFYAYTYRWMRPNDIYDDKFVSETNDPIRKQLLGYRGDSAVYPYYQPGFEDAPLWAFLLKNKRD